MSLKVEMVLGFPQLILWKELCPHLCPAVLVVPALAFDAVPLEKSGCLSWVMTKCPQQDGYTAWWTWERAWWRSSFHCILLKCHSYKPAADVVGTNKEVNVGQTQPLGKIVSKNQLTGLETIFNCLLSSVLWEFSTPVLGYSYVNCSNSRGNWSVQILCG